MPEENEIKEEKTTETAEKEPAETKKPANPNKKRNILLIILIVLVVVLLGVLAYFLGRNTGKKDDTTATVTPSTTVLATTTVSATATAKATATATPDPTTGWKTYSNSDIGLQFKYPNSWSDPTEEKQVGSSDSPIPVDYTYVDFKGSGTQIKSADLSKVSSYSGSAIEENKNKLMTVFSTKSASGADKLMAPSANAAIMANTVPKYIQTADAKFRGIYYFATIGQSYSTTLDAVIILTDGSDKIVQFLFSADSIKSSDYPCISGTDSNCSGSDLEDQTTKFNTYVAAITDTSSETIVKDFNSTYKNIALSVKSL